MDKLLWIALAAVLLIGFLAKRKTGKAPAESPVVEAPPLSACARDGIPFTITELTPPYDPSVDVILVTAAVAACMGLRPEQFVIRSIRRVTGNETTWAQTSRSESVQ